MVHTKNCHDMSKPASRFCLGVLDPKIPNKVAFFNLVTGKIKPCWGFTDKWWQGFKDRFSKDT